MKAFLNSHGKWKVATYHFWRRDREGKSFLEIKNSFPFLSFRQLFLRKHPPSSALLKTGKEQHTFMPKENHYEAQNTHNSEPRKGITPLPFRRIPPIHTTTWLVRTLFAVPTNGQAAIWTEGHLSGQQTSSITTCPSYSIFLEVTECLISVNSIVWWY